MYGSLIRMFFVEHIARCEMKEIKTDSYKQSNSGGWNYSKTRKSYPDPKTGNPIEVIISYGSYRSIEQQLHVEITEVVSKRTGLEIMEYIPESMLKIWENEIQEDIAHNPEQ